MRSASFTDVTYSSVPSAYTYTMYTDKLQYADARQKCLDEGSVLAMPKTPIEQYELNNYIDLMNATSVGYWIGLNNLTEASEQFQWEDGAVLNQNWTVWAGGQPADNNGDPENCVELRHASRKWHDRICSRTSMFICQGEFSRN